MPLTIDQLRDTLDYDPESGVFKWRKKISAKNVVGAIAGSYKPVYAEVGLFGTSYRLHRLAWFYMTGAWPKGEIDHIDQNKKNNAFGNLRDVGRSENLINQDKACRQKRTSQHRGVFPSVSGRWFSRLKVDGKIRHLGTFDTETEANHAYLAEKAKEMSAWNG